MERNVMDPQGHPKKCRREIIGTIIANGGALEHFKAPSGHMGHRPTPPVNFLEIPSIFDELSSTLEHPQRTLPRALIWVHFFIHVRRRQKTPENPVRFYDFRMG